MARSKFRETQMLDADVLTEAEHASAVHTNLVVSGTLTVGTDEGFTGDINIVTGITVSGVVSNATLSFSSGVLVDYTEQEDTYVPVVSPDDPYLSIG
jgi:hypothetical protein